MCIALDVGVIEDVQTLEGIMAGWSNKSVEALISHGSEEEEQSRAKEIKGLYSDYQLKLPFYLSLNQSVIHSYHHTFRKCYLSLLIFDNRKKLSL